ncbi:hypothetical protein BS47DRAFT_1378152 [Hydnum rufescens UP504]|uniref:Protein kinase domain-containing protein n=1 Tax=Hydnum rufescens UP504 TaxID=1448309 RepID=A0A9P6AID3_9AGAM|nr:hypothetical protein BS47DRAFT_1378152 [Hydnum rufescens UP504]
MLLLTKGRRWDSLKPILLHTLRGLAHMHHCGVAHTDLKHDNIMFDVGPLTQADITALIEEDPPRCHPPEQSWKYTAMTRTYMVADFGSGKEWLDARTRPSTFHTYDEITAHPLRVPEIILRGPWDERVDIWAFGCLIFEFTIGSALFVYEPHREYGLDEPTAHLWQILCFTCEQVEASKLGASTLTSLSTPRTLATCSKYNVLEDEDALAMAVIMQRCPHLNPKDRATAQELLQDPWWQDVV